MRMWLSFRWAAVGISAAWLTCLAVALYGSNWTRSSAVYGQVGDTFGVINALFTGGMTCEQCGIQAAIGNPYWSTFPQNCDHRSVV